MDDKDLDIEHRLTEVESSVVNQERRLDDVEKKQEALDKLTECVTIISTNQKHMDGDLQEIKKDVKDLAGIPAQRWHKVIGTVISTLIGGFITWIIMGAPGVK